MLLPALRRSLQHRRQSPLHCRQQTREVFSYLSEVIRTGSLNPPNPILHDLDRAFPPLPPPSSDDYEESVRATIRSSTTSSPIMPQLKTWKPSRVENAVDTLEERYDKQMAAFADTLTKRKKDLGNYREVLECLQDVMDVWEQIHAPLHALHHSLSLLAILSGSASVQEQWHKELSDEIATRLPGPGAAATLHFINAEHPTALRLYKLLKRCLQLMDSSDGTNMPPELEEQQQQRVWTARQWIQSFRNQTGHDMPPGGGDRSVFEDNLSSIQALEARLLEASDNQLEGDSNRSNGTIINQQNARALQQRLQDSYALIELRNQNSTMLGFPYFAAQVLESCRMAQSVHQVQALHDELAPKLLPQVESFPLDLFDLELSLGELPQPTLEGGMAALSQLTRELFGVELRAEERGSKNLELCTWQQDVRLFHVYDHRCDENSESVPSYIGSIYLDPFRRPNKLRRPFSLTVWDQPHPVVAVALGIRSPTWADTKRDANMTWDDAETLFHEFGHALHFLLSESSSKALQLPHDVSEVMPKFMEHWLFRQSTLQTVMEHSQSNSRQDLTKEDLAQLQEWRSQRKAYQLLQHIFFGSLELELFSHFDPRGEESMVGLQRRMAEKYIPHDLPAKQDLSPILQIVTENAGGGHVANYRYLWSEVLCAGIYKPFLKQGVTSELGQQLRDELFDPSACMDLEATFATLQGRDDIFSTDPLFELYNFSK